MDETVMNKRNQQGIALSFFLLLSSFFICLCSCNVNGSEPSKYKSFDYDLRGTWESNDKTVYSGKLVITSDTITITGYPKPDEGDPERPFKDFPKGVALKGYSEDSKLFIKKGDSEQDGIPYYLYESVDKVKMLEFTFSGLQDKEILQRTAVY